MKEVISTEGAHLYRNPEVLSPADIRVFLEKGEVSDPAGLDEMRETMGKKGGDPRTDPPPTGALPPNHQHRIGRAVDDALLKGVLAGDRLLRLRGHARREKPRPSPS